MYKYILTRDDEYNILTGDKEYNFNVQENKQLDNYSINRSIEQDNNIKYLTDEQILLKCDASIKNEDIYPHQERVYAIGDIHGDLEAFMVLLQEVCKVCEFDCPIRDNKNIKSHNDITFRWTGEKAYVVMVGDTIDRKRTGSIKKDNLLVGEIENEEIILLNLINRIAIEASNAGGRLIKLLGNHEIMNLYSNFDYVSDQTIKENGGLNMRINKTQPGGDLAKMIIKCGTLGIVKIGDWIFVHGGILPALVNAVRNSGVYNFINKANSLARDMFLNTLNSNDKKINKKLIKYYFTDNNLEKLKIEDFKNEDEYTKKELENLFIKRDSMLNERRLSLDNYGGVKVPISSMCLALKLAFKLLGYKENLNLVVAHTVQLERGLFQRSKDDPGYISGYVYKNLECEDDSRYIYTGPGEKYKKNISSNDVDNMFPHGLNFECPHDIKNPQLGQLWRIDTGVSRGFDNDYLKDCTIPDKLIEKILKARRPSALEILHDKDKGYTTKVIVAKKGLTRDWLIDRLKCNINNKHIIDDGNIF